MKKPIHHPISKFLVILFHLVFLFSFAKAQLPVANFTATPLVGCSPLVVSFQDISTGSPFSWNWDFGNGQLSSSRNPTVTYSFPGSYTVKLVVKNANGVDEEIKTDIITVTPSPNPAISADRTTACAPATIQFSDQTTFPPGSGTITNWLWDFGDGITSTLQNPSHTYTTVGFFTVSLQITSSTGCQRFTSIGRYIRIINGITADFNYSDPSTCQAPFTVGFQNLSSGPGTLSYAWSFGNGGPGSTLQNPSATYPTAGSYNVSLDVQSDLGCSQTITKSVAIAGKTTNFNPPASICIGQTVTFQNNSSPAPVSAFWDFGDGTTSAQINPSKVYLAGGTFPVKLINNYGSCIDSITKNVTIISQPPVNFTVNDSTACKAPFTAQFSDLSPGAATWLWNFGDGGSSNLQNPTYTYSASGNFNVSLTITLPGGCSNTLTKSQLIKIKSTTIDIAGLPAGGCIPYTFRPLPEIQSVDSIVSYSWDMGEPGAIYNTKLPAHIYKDTGSFDITLTVTTQTGCIISKTYPKGVRTGTLPTVKFSFFPNNSCASIPVQFTDLSDTTAGFLVTRFWDFGDSLTSTFQHPLHIYEDTGSMRVQLTVSNNGCRDTASKPIKIFPPVAKFGYSVNCNNRLRVTFLDSSLADIAFGPITYEWRMGDPANTIIFGPVPPVFTYPAYGIYTATLIVTNGPCSYQKTKKVVLINESPGIAINKNPVCKGEIFTVNALVSDTTFIKDYTWTIAGTTISDTSQALDFSLPVYGNYDVTLTIEDINGCFNTTTNTNFITVTGPRANFSVNGPGGCENSTVSFTDLSVTAGSPITEWIWGFGDGTQQTFTTSPFTHTYAQTGSYTVTLAVKDNANCADTISIANAVLISKPVAAFRADTVYCPLSPLQFIDTSSGSGLSYNWKFGDGATSTLQNPLHSFAAGDTAYTIQLTVRDLSGCTDSISKTNYVKIRFPKPSFDIVDSSGICIPLQTSFVFKGTDYKSYSWDFGDGSMSPAQNPSHFYSSYGGFTPTLYLTGPGGCTDSIKSAVNLLNPFAVTQIAFGPDTACNTITTNFNISAPNGFNYRFNFGDGNIDSSGQTNLTHTYSSPGMYYPYVLLTDKFGCGAGINTATPVVVYGAIPVFGKDKKEFCDNGEVFFQNYTLNNDPVISWAWNFGDGNTSNLPEPSHIYNGANTYIISLTATTQNQCIRSTSDTVRVYPTPIISIQGRDTICLNQSETYSGILSQPDSTIKWQWAFGNGATSQTQPANVTYTATGNYPIQLIAANKLGCADTTVNTVNVPALPTATPVSDPLTIISGATVPLIMDYKGPIVSYNWLPPTRLDCITCPQPEANPQFTTRYSVGLTDKYGCTNKGYITVKVVCTGQNFFIPNTFSPNGDGANEIFYLRGSGIFRIKVLRIFNRWGEVVFEKREVPVNNTAYGWDGNYNGKAAQAGVYIYQLEFLCDNNEVKKLSGNIALIR